MRDALRAIPGLFLDWRFAAAFVAACVVGALIGLLGGLPGWAIVAGAVGIGLVVARR